MRANQAALQKQYTQQVRRALADEAQMRDYLLERINDSMEDYLQAHPDATMQDLYEEYGDPKRIAADALQDAEPQKTLARLRQNRRVRWAMAVVIAVLVAVVAFFVATKGVMVITTERVYTSFPADMTNEEFEQAVKEQFEREHRKRIAEDTVRKYG